MSMFKDATPTQIALHSQRRARIKRFQQAVVFSAPPSLPEPAPSSTPARKEPWFQIVNVRALDGTPLISEIQKTVCRYYHCSMADLLSQRRGSGIAHIRQIAAYLSCDLTAHSSGYIGRKFGDRDHTTILHSRDRIKAKMTTDQKLAGQIAELRKILTENGNGNSTVAADLPPTAL
jgi:hypothetical protein